MKNLKLLNKKLFLISFIFIFISNTLAEDKPSDIWNITEQQTQELISTKDLSQDNNQSDNKILENSIYKMQPKSIKSQIEFDQNLASDHVRILGLYDPEDNGLDINMWSNSDGDQLKKIFLFLQIHIIQKKIFQVRNFCNLNLIG